LFRPDALRSIDGAGRIVVSPISIWEFSLVVYLSYNFKSIRRRKNMDAATISSKYQLVIPRKIREQYNIKPGYKAVFITFEKDLHVVFVPPLDQARGMFPGIDTNVEREEGDRV